MSDTLGERIKSLRTNRGLTAAQLAACIGIGENAVFKLESGLTRQPSFAVGIKLARTLGVSPDELAFGETRPDTTPPAGRFAEAVEVRDLALEVQQLREDVHLLLGDRLARPVETETQTKRRRPS